MLTGRPLEIDIPWSDGKTLAWIYAHGEVISRNDRKESVNLTVRLHPRDANRLNGGVLN